MNNNGCIWIRLVVLLTGNLMLFIRVHNLLANVFGGNEVTQIIMLGEGVLRASGFVQQGAAPEFYYAPLRKIP